MTEILNTEYTDSGPSPVFGPETGETGVDRLAFDDVDDFHGWSSNPPQQRDGSAVFNASGWQRDVTVEWVDPGNPAIGSGSDQGVKRITVTVRRDGNVVTQIISLRTSKYLP